MDQDRTPTLRPPAYPELEAELYLSFEGIPSERMTEIPPPSFQHQLEQECEKA